MIQRNRRILPCSWIGRINVVKMAVLPKAIYPCNEYPYEILMTFSTELEQIILLESQKAQNCQSKPEEKEHSWRQNAPRLQAIQKSLLYSYGVVFNSFATPWTVAHHAPLSMEFSRKRILKWVAIFFRESSQPRDQTHVSCIGRWILYHWATWEAQYKAIVIKTAWYWHKNWHMDQWNRIESPEIKSTKPTVSLQQKRQKHTMEKRQSLQQVVLRKLTATCKSMKLEHILTPYTKINSRWLQDLNIKHGTIKLKEENIGKIFSDISHTNVSLGQSPKTIEIKKINKWDLIKLISFFTIRETIKWKDNLQTWRKYCK